MPLNAVCSSETQFEISRSKSIAALGRRDRENQEQFSPEPVVSNQRISSTIPGPIFVQRGNRVDPTNEPPQPARAANGLTMNAEPRQQPIQRLAAKLNGRSICPAYLLDRKRQRPTTASPTAKTESRRSK